MRSPARFAVALGAVTAIVLAGCASTVAGRAQPAASAVAPSSEPQVPASSLPSATSATGSTAARTSMAPSTESTSASAPQTSGGPGPTGSGTTSGSSGASSTAYPTTPAQLIKTPRTATQAALLEGARIASYLVVPTFIDPTLTKGSISTMPLYGPKAMTILFGADVMPSVAQRAGMISGFSSSRSDADNNNLIVAAIEFPSAASAKAAAPLLAAAAANKGKDKGKANIPGFPAAVGWYGAFSSDYGYYQAFLAQGALVLYVWVTGPKLNTPTLQAARAARAFQVETAAMAKFVPTPPAKLMQLPIDPDGMEAHTLLNSADDASATDGVVTAAGQLHYDTDPVGTQQLFARAGVDLVSDGRTSVYRAKDAAGAVAVRDGFVAFVEKSTSGMTPYTLTADVPAVSCLQQALNSKYYCVGVAGRYAFEINADSVADLNAAAAAQYAMLQGF
ncbi:hypothetical protein SAMN04515671_2582 [Nakamurella panacisegetis]|uniref:Uncharacterized protein n=1 Tax=Nakamurella panacisegetis TaxID=1090615 RepID=A0A1H0P1E0_9ACTN|nr:hypothetical protein [Nakamurella panacisegetis]SDO98887.1 hypothetical protein SAMN04515671_2582 [Nakamurella panacisegetis]